MKRFRKLIKISRDLIDLPDTRYKHFSFLIRRNKIISVGYNLSFHTDPLAHRYNYRFSNIHSELSCIKNFPYSPSILNRFTLVNIRIMGNGEIGLSKPCKKCQRLLKDFNVNTVWYSDFGEIFRRM